MQVPVHSKDTISSKEHHPRTQKQEYPVLADTTKFISHRNKHGFGISFNIIIYYTYAQGFNSTELKNFQLFPVVKLNSLLLNNRVTVSVSELWSL